MDISKRTKESILFGRDEEKLELLKIEIILKDVGLNDNQLTDIMMSLDEVFCIRDSRTKKALHFNQDILMEEAKLGLISKVSYLMQRYDLSYEEAEKMVPN